MKKILLILLAIPLVFAMNPQVVTNQPIHVKKPIPIWNIIRNVSVVETNETKTVTITTPRGEINITKNLENGTRIISMKRGPVNRIMVITNRTKEIYITTPRSVISIVKDKENKTKEIHIESPKVNITIIKTKNETLTDVERKINETEEIRKFVINPVKRRIVAWLRVHNVTNATEIPPRVVRIMARIKNRVANITFNQTGVVQFRFGNITVVTKREVEIENGTIWIKTEKIRKRITVLPEEAIRRAEERARFHKVKKVEIDTEGNTTVYRIRGVRVGKLFGLFQVNVPVETGVDTESAQVVKVKRPWWAFLVRMAK